MVLVYHKPDTTTPGAPRSPLPSPHPRPAFVASASEKIAPQMTAARGAPPVEGGVPYKCGNARDLRSKELSLRERSEEIGPLIDHAARQNEEQRYRHGDELPALAGIEFPHDLLGIFFLHHGNVLLSNDVPQTIGCAVHSSTRVLHSATITSRSISSIFFRCRRRRDHCGPFSAERERPAWAAASCPW